MEPGAKHRDDGYQVPNKFLFWRKVFTVDHHDLGMMSLTECLKVFIAEAYQPIAVSDDKASHLSEFNHLHEPIELFALVVKPTADIRHPLIDLDGLLFTVGFKRVDLID